MDRTERQTNFLLDLDGPIDIEVNAAVDFEQGLLVLGAMGECRPADLREVTLTGFSMHDVQRPRRRHRLRQRLARFVDLLEQHGREGVREVTLDSVWFDAGRTQPIDGAIDGDGDAAFAQEDQARLFGEVLPNLPRLEGVCLSDCTGCGTNVALFASRLTATSALVELDIDKSLDRFGDFATCVPALADMIRSNVPLQVLKLNTDGLMDKDECRQIFDSLQHNANLRHLEVRVLEVYDDVRILPPTSSIRILRIAVGRWTDEAKSILANQLKTNTVLEELHVVHQQRTVDHGPWIEMLASHNYALRILSEGPRYDDHEGPTYVDDGRVVAYLLRNDRIRRALDHLQGTYHVAPTVLLPRVLHMVRTLPTLIYRFVRTGNVDALADLLLARQEQQEQQRSGGGSGSSNRNPQRKRSRPSPPSRP